MRFLILLLVLTMNIQPLAAESCDMVSAAHAGHQAQLDDTDHGDCCDTETDAQAHDCQQASHCGTCTAAVFLASFKHAAVSTAALPFDKTLAAGQLPPSHSSPPFRPPIS